VDLRAAFLRDAGGDSVAMYGLFNEAVATALAQGLVQRRVLSEAEFEARRKRPRSFYEDDAIDGAAKAILPLVEATIARGESIGDAFVASYLAAVRGALGSSTSALSLRLRGLVLSYDEELAPALDGLRQRMSVGSSFAWPRADDEDAIEFLTRYRDLSGVVLVRPTHLEALVAWDRLLGAGVRAQIARAAKEGRPFAWAAARSPYATLLVLVANTAAEIAPLLDLVSRAHAPIAGRLRP
jgi:hypothetical protein